MIDAIFKILGPILLYMFFAGVAGCCLVIPIVAYRLFKVLFESDAEDEK